MEEMKEEKAHCLLLQDKSEFDISASDKEDVSKIFGIHP